MPLKKIQSNRKSALKKKYKSLKPIFRRNKMLMTETCLMNNTVMIQCMFYHWGKYNILYPIYHFYSINMLYIIMWSLTKHWNPYTDIFKYSIIIITGPIILYNKYSK